MPELCPGLQGISLDDFMYGGDSGGCLEVCEENPALKALIDPYDCESTVWTLLNVSPDFEESCEGGGLDCSDYPPDECEECCLDEHGEGLDDLETLVECLICDACQDVCDTDGCGTVGTGTCGAQTGEDECWSSYGGGCINTECALFEVCNDEFEQCFFVNPECAALNECLGGCPR